MGKRELVALLNLSSWCNVMVERLFLAVPRGCLRFVIVVFPDHTHLLFLITYDYRKLPFYADAGKKQFKWIHDAADVNFCCFNMFLLKLCTMLPNTDPDICDL